MLYNKITLSWKYQPHRFKGQSLMLWLFVVHGQYSRKINVLSMLVSSHFFLMSFHLCLAFSAFLIQVFSWHLSPLYITYLHSLQSSTVSFNAPSFMSPVTISCQTLIHFPLRADVFKFFSG